MVRHQRQALLPRRITSPERHMHRSRTAGFTLIELLIVVVIIGILAAIAVPKFANTKGKAYVSAMKTDLRNLATAEESYYYSHDAYTTDQSLLGFTKSAQVNIQIHEATMGGWSATATHPQAMPTTCAIFVGNVQPVAPATNEGTIVCQ
jgi:prepilin-type N-terminal cleavage/methylation domain-containing protein